MVLERLSRLGLPVAGAFLAACAATTAPTPPPRETLLILNGGENSLSLIPTDSVTNGIKVPLGALSAPAQDVAARRGIALVAGGAADQLLVVDLQARTVLRSIALTRGSGASSVTIVTDEIAYVTNPSLNTVTRVNYVNGDTASVAVGQTPSASVLARGRLFVVNANLGPCEGSAPGPCPIGASWITVIDPGTNQHATGRDSIGLPGPGNATAADIGPDGLIYIVNTGAGTDSVPGRLSIVDPVQRQEVGNFSGFGPVPGHLATDGQERLFVTSVRDGLMEFNVRTRRVVRGAGNGILIQDNVAAAVSASGVVYAVEAPGCAAGTLGRVRVLRSDLTQARTLFVGVCPTAAAIVDVPVFVPPSQ
ncbi:MAG: hypothetical protein ABI647_08870 [Gemmatimonadota bacterium]